MSPAQLLLMQIFRYSQSYTQAQSDSMYLIKGSLLIILLVDKSVCTIPGFIGFACVDLVFFLFLVLHLNFQPTIGHFYDTWIICNFIGTDPCSTVGVCVFVQEKTLIYGLKILLFKKIWLN